MVLGESFFSFMCGLIIILTCSGPFPLHKWGPAEEEKKEELSWKEKEERRIFRGEWSGVRGWVSWQWRRGRWDVKMSDEKLIHVCCVLHWMVLRTWCIHFWLRVVMNLYVESHPSFLVNICDSVFHSFYCTWLPYTLILTPNHWFGKVASSFDMWNIRFCLELDSCDMVGILESWILGVRMIEPTLFIRVHSLGERIVYFPGRWGKPPQNSQNSNKT